MSTMADDLSRPRLALAFLIPPLDDRGVVTLPACLTLEPLP
jgi:hypothetical protein